MARLISADTGTDTLTAFENATGSAGNDNISGNALDNILRGGGGADTLNGGVGNDTMIGGTGNDTYFVDNALDVVTQNVGEGADTIWTNANYTLAAGSEVETLKVNG